MTTRIIPVEPFDLIVFGATGDLAQRTLLPALFHRDEQGQIPAKARIIGVSRRPMTKKEFRKFARGAIAAHVDIADRREEVCDRFFSRLTYVPADASADNGWSELAKILGSGEDVVR